MWWWRRSTTLLESSFQALPKWYVTAWKGGERRRRPSSFVASLSIMDRQKERKGGGAACEKDFYRPTWYLLSLSDRYARYRDQNDYLFILLYSTYYMQHNAIHLKMNLKIREYSFSPCNANILASWNIFLLVEVGVRVESFFPSKKEYETWNANFSSWGREPKILTRLLVMFKLLRSL